MEYYIIKRSTIRTKKVFKVALFLPITQHKSKYLALLWELLTKIKSDLLLKHFIHKVMNICVNTLIQWKQLFFHKYLCFPFLIFCIGGFCNFCFSLRQTGQYQLLLRTSFKCTHDKWNHTHLHLSEWQSIQVSSDEYGLLQKQYNLTFCPSNIFGAEFSVLLVRTSGKVFWI